MVKKLLCLMVVCLLLVPCSALAESRVFDNANLFTTSEIQELEAYIEQLRADYQMDVAVLTSNDAPLNKSFDYAQKFYINNDLGMGDDYTGFLYFIDMHNREPWICTSGVMIDYINDSRRDTLLDVGYNDLARARYGSAAMTVLRQLNVYLRQGREAGSFRYDAVTGERLSGLYNPLTAGEMVAAAIAGFVVAAIIVASVSGSYQLKGGTYRYSVTENTSRSLTKDEEQFVTQRVTRHARQPVHTGSSSHGSSHSTSRSSGKGSAVHHTSSGRSFGGGGGRKF